MHTITHHHDQEIDCLSDRSTVTSCFIMTNPICRSDLFITVIRIKIEISMKSDEEKTSKSEKTGIGPDHKPPFR